MPRQSLNIDSNIYKLRDALHLSQEEFASKIGLTRSGISALESSKRNLTESNRKLICATYNVNPDWLESGEGEMFKSDFIDEFAYYCAKFGAEEDEFKKMYILELLKLYDSLSDEEWQARKILIKNTAIAIKD